MEQIKFNSVSGSVIMSGYDLHAVKNIGKEGGMWLWISYLDNLSSFVINYLNSYDENERKEAKIQLEKMSPSIKNQLVLANSLEEGLKILNQRLQIGVI